MLDETYTLKMKEKMKPVKTSRDPNFENNENCNLEFLKW